MARIMDFWERAGWLDRSDLIGPSAWYAHFGMPFAAESLLYYDVPDSEKQAGILRAALRVTQSYSGIATTKTSSAAATSPRESLTGT